MNYKIVFNSKIINISSSYPSDVCRYVYCTQQQGVLVTAYVSSNLWTLIGLVPATTTPTTASSTLVAARAHHSTATQSRGTGVVGTPLRISLEQRRIRMVDFVIGTT